MSGKYATVLEVCRILQNLIDRGYGDYELEINREYALKKEDEPEINEKYKNVNLGGYV